MKYVAIIATDVESSRLYQVHGPFNTEQEAIEWGKGFIKMCPSINDVRLKVTITQLQGT